MPLPQQGYIVKSKYARYIDALQRREEWPEVVARYFKFADKHIQEKFPHAYAAWKNNEAFLHGSVENFESMPSMRLLMTAGEAVERNNIAAYNCAYLTMKTPRSFSNMLLILMCGTGVGFSCERQYVGQLPKVPTLRDTAAVIDVEDSKEGWAEAVYHLMNHLFFGSVPKVNYSNIRPRGARLKTFGGRASGPEPLQRLVEFVIATFREAQGRALTSAEVHHICCMIADIVVVGGVRRSALISLSNLSDTRMRNVKHGSFWQQSPHLALANNSAVYTERPEMEIFIEEWQALIRSKSGERGIFNRQAAQRQAATYGFRSEYLDYGCNPCSEIILRDGQFCNLTEVVVRATDTRESLRRKVEACTVMGVYQSTLTYFPNVSDEFRENCEEERLLGVSLTGLRDCPLLNRVTPEAEALLDELREYARQVATMWAQIFAIPVPAAITCVKPSGTVAQLVDAGTGGLHTRYAPYYLRTYRQDNKDPLTQFLKDQNVHWEPSAMKPDSETIFTFAVKSPESAIFRKDTTAIDQLEYWLMLQKHWCEHKPSMTVYVKDDEWLEVGAWVYKNFDMISGVSFLPYDNGSYIQAPFQEISKEAYEKFISMYPGEIDWKQFVELDDDTEGSQELACVGGACLI